MRPAVYYECLQLIATRDRLDRSDLHPVMLSQIIAIEDELGAHLPDQYEDFILEAGVGTEHGGLASWYHLDLTRPGNVIAENARLRSSQAKEMRERGRKRCRFPKGFLAIYDPHEGEVFGFVRDGNSYGVEVFLWDLDEYYLELAYDSFAEFLDGLVDCSSAEVEVAEKRARQRSASRV